MEFCFRDIVAFALSMLSAQMSPEWVEDEHKKADFCGFANALSDATEGGFFRDLEVSVDEETTDILIAFTTSKFSCNMRGLSAACAAAKRVEITPKSRAHVKICILLSGIWQKSTP